MMLKWLPYQDADPELGIRLGDQPGTFRYKGKKVNVASLANDPNDWTRLEGLPFEVRWPGGTVVYVRRVPESPEG